MFVGVLLLLLGILMLSEKLGYLPGDTWDYFLPIALVALGVSMMFRDRNSKRW